MSEEHLELVLVYQTGDTVHLGLIRSLLENEGIPSVTQGESVQDLLGWGRIGFEYNPLTGPAQLFVKDSDADRARELLAAFDESCDAESSDTE